MSNTISLDLKKEMFFDMLRIRRVEERIEAEYLGNEMRTPVHLCIGQEAIAVGACKALKRDDTISSSHRSHGHYLAKGGNLNAMIAELHCRSTGCSKGFGGSMHLVDTAVGHLGSSSIVGGGIPIGTGHALAFALRGEDRVSVVFLGDGAAEEGVLYESINFAVLKRLPVVYVVENNRVAVCSPLKARQPGPLIFHKAYPPNQLASCFVDGNNVEAVYAAALVAVNRARRGEGPSFLECETYRILGHMGTASQDPGGYRDPTEVAAWRQKCPVSAYEERLIRENVLSIQEFDAMKDEVNHEVDSAFTFAKQSPLPDPSEAAGTVYCE